jgi:signal transduction histidine kinase/DNA-binding response OmpR family regulator
MLPGSDHLTFLGLTRRARSVGLNLYRRARYFRPRRLSLQILFLVGVFTLPMALAALYFIVTGINKDIDFATHEQHGDAYLMPLGALLEKLPQHERVALRLLAGDKTAQSELIALQEGIEKTWRQVAAVQQQYGSELQFTSEGLAKRKREHVLLPTVVSEWNNLRIHLNAQTPATIINQHQHLLEDIRTMITHAGDTSFLILDPDLDSYYLMDATLQALPETQSRLAALLDYGEDALRSLEAARASRGAAGLQPEQRIQLAVFRALLKQSDEDRILGDTSTALNEDAGFYGISESLQRNLPPATKKYELANEALLTVLDRLTEGETPGDLTELCTKTAAARNASFRLWKVAVPELDRLLDARIRDRLRTRSQGLAATGFALSLSALVAFFVIADITRSLRRIMLTLRTRMAALSSGGGEASFGNPRAEAESKNELSILSDAFDELLAGIERRDIELDRHRQNLETQVALRTEQLTEANRQVESARQKAEESTRLKGEFLANMSHEIRTPMNGVVGMTELALETELTREQRDYLSIVKSSAGDLLTIINDILDFSRIEAGKLPLNSVAFDLRKLLSDTAKSLALRAHQKGLELLWWVTPDVPEVLLGDPVRLRQVIVNLIGNALKFTDTGEILLRVETDPEGMTKLRFSVKDTGIGIPSDKQSSIFEAFSQVDGSAARSYGGTGLGLAIVSQLVSLMGGEVSVQSEPGYGSTFTFSACFGITDTPVDVRLDLARYWGMRVLVVDDNATARDILRQLLCGWGLEPILVEDGQQALQTVLKAEREGMPFAIALIDSRMPDMDGFTLAGRIRESAGVARAPIMMLTAVDQQEYTRSRESGIEAYVLKPINSPELLEVILGRINGVAAEGLTGAYELHSQVIPKESPQFQILAVEDNLVNQKLIVRLLEKRGHSVTLACDGFQALAVLAETSFDLIFMDIQMPGLTGYDVTARIRAREDGSGARVPIIALTAHAMGGDKERCLNAGMDGYLTKPIRFQDLDEILASAIRCTPVL